MGYLHRIDGRYFVQTFCYEVHMNNFVQLSILNETARFTETASFTCKRNLEMISLKLTAVFWTFFYEIIFFFIKFHESIFRSPEALGRFAKTTSFINLYTNMGNVCIFFHFSKLDIYSFQMRALDFHFRFQFQFS